MVFRGAFGGGSLGTWEACARSEILSRPSVKKVLGLRTQHISYYLLTKVCCALLEVSTRCAWLGTVV